MGSTMGIQSVNMTCTRLTFILAVLIAPACSTSVGFAIKKRWSAAGCSGTDTLIYDKIQMGKGPTDGSCNEEVGDTPTAYEKTTCTANTATDGYSNGDYTDAGCTTLVAGEVLTTKPTNECVTNTGSVTEYETWVCGTTSPTLGGVYYQQYNAAGCPDSNRTSAGYFAVNYCKKDSTNGAWKDSSKDVIENGKIQTYEWEDSSTFSTTERLAAKGCTGGGTAKVNATYTLNACTAALGQSGVWYKMGALIDGASIDGYSTVSGNTATSAAISVFLGVVCTVLNLMFC